MRENWFEKRLKSKVSKENHELDFDGVWSDIQANRSNKDRKKPFFWRWGIIVFLLMGFGFAFMINSGQDKNNRIQNSTILKASGSEVINDGKTHLASTQTNTSLEEDINSTESVNNKKTKLNSNLNTKTTQSTYSSSFLNSKNNKTNSEDFNASRSSVVNSEIKLSSNLNQEYLDGFSNYNKGEKSSLKSLSFKNSSENSNKIKPELQSDFAKPLNTLKAINAIEMVDLSAMDIKKRELNLIPSWDALSSPRRTTIENKDMLSFGFSFGLNNDKLTSTLDTGSISKIIDRRNTVESRLDYFASNISYKRFISSKIFLNVGMGFEQYTSRFEYEDYTFTSGSRIDTTEIIIYENGEMSFVSAEVPFVTTTINKNTNYLKYRSITIPVGLGLSTDLNETFNIELEAGIAYHLRLLNKGNVLNSELASEDLRPLEDLYKSSNQWSSYAGFSIHRYLGENWKVGLGVRANFDISNRALVTSGFSHKMSSYSGQIILSRLF